MTYALVTIINLAAQAYFWVIVVTVVLSWLIAFNVINHFNPTVRAVQKICYALTEPLLAPIRRAMPNLGGLDISPIVLLLGLEAVRLILLKILTGY